MKRRNHFRQNYSIFGLLQFLAKNAMTSLYNQLLQFLRYMPIWTCAKMFQIYWSSASTLMKKKKYFFYKFMAFSNLEIFQVLISTGWQDCIINFFHRFLAIDLTLPIAITDILKIYTCYVEEKWEWGIEEEGNKGMDKCSMGASSVSYRHNFLVGNYCSPQALKLVKAFKQMSKWS